jgi:hypothetical protein
MAAPPGSPRRVCSPPNAASPAAPSARPPAGDSAGASDCRTGRVRCAPVWTEWPEAIGQAGARGAAPATKAGSMPSGRSRIDSIASHQLMPVTISTRWPTRT